MALSRDSDGGTAVAFQPAWMLSRRRGSRRFFWVIVPVVMEGTPSALNPARLVPWGVDVAVVVDIPPVGCGLDGLLPIVACRSVGSGETVCRPRRAHALTGEYRETRAEIAGWWSL